jgi:predicted DNA-binding transcriptional regulator YafY
VEQTPDVATDPTGRVLQLLSLLQTHRSWTSTELAERLEVTDRTVRRDVERLRGLGYPVEATAGAAGGYRLAAGAHLPPLVLDDEEAVAIAVGLRTAASAAIAGFEDTSLRALAKIEQLLPDRLRRRTQAIHEALSTHRWAGPDEAQVDVETLAVLAQACRDDEEVRFDYRRRDGEESQRLVQPNQLVSLGRRWYLLAWDVRRDDWRTFRLDRMARTRLAGARFDRRTPPGGDAAAFVAASVQSAPRPHVAELSVACSAEEATEVLRWHDADVAERPDGTCTVVLRADDPDWLVAVVARVALLSDVTVHGSEEVADAVATLGQRLTAAVTAEGQAKPATGRTV